MNLFFLGAAVGACVGCVIIRLSKLKSYEVSDKRKENND